MNIWLSERFFFYLDAVDQHFALTLQQAEQELHDGGLACAVGPDQSDRLSLFDPERHVVQYLFALFVCKTHIPEFNHLYYLITSPPMSWAMFPYLSIRKNKMQTAMKSASRALKRSISA